MLSIYTTFKGLHKDGKPMDFLAMWKKTFDKASEREVTMFQKMYCDEWCEYNTPQMSLTAEAIQGKYRIRIMATVIGNESPTPLRRSDGFDAWTGEIPRLGHKFPLRASEYRKLMEVYKNPFITETAKVKAIEKTLRDDMKNAYLGCKDVMDYILLKSLSNNGVCQFTPTLNNPGGRSFEVDYDMSEANKLISWFLWNDANVASGKINPIFMLSVLCSDLRERGIEPGEILCSQDIYFWLKNNAATKLMVHGTDKKDKSVSKSQFDELLSDNEICPISVVKRRMGQEKNGERTTVEPWDHNFIAIKPAGKIAEIQPAIEDNELMEEENVEYMNAGNGIRIAKWRTGDSTGQVAAEYTQGSWRAIPAITEIDAIICFQVRGFVEKKSSAGDESLRRFWTQQEYAAAASLPTM
jgi:hypothetical protein